MRFSFNTGFDTMAMIYEIYKGEELIKHQHMDAPHIMHKTNFLSLIDQLSKDPNPMRFKISYPETIWDEIEQTHKTLSNSIEFKNPAYLKEYGES